MEEPKKKRKKGKLIVLLVILVILIVAIASCASCMNSLGSGGKNEVVDASGQNKSEEKKDARTDQKKELTEGKSFEDNGLKITLKKVDTDFTDYDDEGGYNTPKKGMKYVMASFKFENTGNSDRYVDSFDFDCYADDANCEQVYDLDDEGSVSLNLSAGRKVSFKVYYMVPKNAKKIELEYETDIWSDEKAVIRLK